VSTVPPPPDRSRLPPQLRLKFAAAAGLSLLVVALVPRTVSHAGSTPPVGMMLVTATLVSLVCAAVLAWGLHRDLRLPVSVALYTCAFNVLVVVVKLVLAPRGFYEVNQRRTLNGWVALDNAPMALLAAALVFALYLAAYLLLYRFFRERIAHLGERDPVPRIFGKRALVVVLVVVALVLVSGGAALLLVLIPLAAGFEYLGFVFSSALSLLIAVTLAGATALAALAFDRTSDRARVVGDATLFMSFFWVGLYFLALYHVLWVVYVLVLTSIWPLKVVTPK